MDTTKLKEKFDAFRNNDTTKKVAEVAGKVLVMAITGIAVKAVTYIAVEGTKALISEINTKVNKN